MTSKLAYVASVSIRFRSKERPSNRIFGFDRTRNETKAKKMEEGRERKETLADKPPILKTYGRQRTQRLIGSASPTVLTCVDQRFFSY